MGQVGKFLQFYRVSVHGVNHSVKVPSKTTSQHNTGEKKPRRGGVFLEPNRIT
jgi:hypothetical protein